MYRSQDGDAPAELESQLILRLPEEHAKVVRDAINNNSNLKDILEIKIENDLRYGEVIVDHHLLKGKIVDLPTVIESLKTIDGKGFYKTADICQMLVCKEGDDPVTEEETQQKTKKKDSNKVDKKYLFPHGITPPTKNVRKRRFRKTLRKKFAEAPEIEKEVKRLFRSDIDAVSVKWEVIDEEDDKINKGSVVIKKEPLETSQNVGEHDIFGSALSDSEEEDVQLNILDIDENSGDSRLTDSNSVKNMSGDKKLLTEFSSDMFDEMQGGKVTDYYQQSQSSTSYPSKKPISRVAIEQRIDELESQLAELQVRRQQHENKIEVIENMALRQRFQGALDRIKQEQIDKGQEQNELQQILKHTD